MLTEGGKEGRRNVQKQMTDSARGRTSLTVEDVVQMARPVTGFIHRLLSAGSVPDLVFLPGTQK